MAREVSVHRQSVSRWAAALTTAGDASLKASGGCGRKARLSVADLSKIEQALQRGPEALGYVTGLWTLPRVAELIEHECGVHYHPGHVWKILRKLKWSVQRPVGRAVERNEENIERWKASAMAQGKSWPAGPTIVFIDESGLSEGPHRCRTWAPRGHPPVLQFHFNWKTLSAIAGVIWWNFYFRLYPGSIRSPQFDFLGCLLSQLPGPLLVVWDGLPVHRSCKVAEFISKHRDRLQIEWLPAYAPELNPVEYLWGYLKHHAVPNLCPKNLGEVSRVARRALGRVLRQPLLMTAFWKQAELFQMSLY